MSVDVVEDLFQVYVGSVPPDMTATPYGQDVAYVIAEVMAVAEEEVSRLSEGAKLSTATGLFLEQHAKDRGLRRQDGETEDQLRARLQKPPQAITVGAIKEAVIAIVEDPNVFIIELPLRSAFYDRVTFFDRDSYFGGGRGVVIVLIPASANAFASVVDAVRSKIAAGKIFFVLEYTT